MVRLLNLLAAALVPFTASAADGGAGDRHSFHFQADLAFARASSALESWTRGGPGKLRFDEDAGGLASVGGFVDYHGGLAPTVTAHVTATLVDDASHGLDVTEAYLQWRPVPRSPNRHQLRVGALYPPLSLENSGPGWSSPYSLSYSAINTWVAEEVRVFGAEWSLRRPLGGPGSPHRLKVMAAGFYGNDPTGTLVVLRGWSVNDRQTRLFDALTLPNGDTLEPLRELDGRPGYYAGIEWRYSKRVLVRAMRYDNRADPEAFSSGHWGWDTRFDNVGVQLALPWDLGVVAQWLRGNTIWILGATPTGELRSFSRLLDNELESRFVLLTRDFGGHRFSVRVEEFHVGGVEDGDSWTAAYSVKATPRLTVAAEWMVIETDHPRWARQGVHPRQRERQLQVRLSYGFGQARP